MTIEEIKVWRERIKTHGLGMAEGKPVVGVIDALLEEVERLNDCKGCDAPRQLTVATEALDRIVNATTQRITTARYIARTALERIKE